MTDRRAAEIMYPDQGKNWRIELRYKPIAHRGHAFLALVDKDNKTVSELHGLSFSRHTGKQMMVGMDGDNLEGRVSSGTSPMGGEKRLVGEVFSGSKEEAEQFWAKGTSAVKAINEKKFNYKAHDPSFELGTDGGQIQNSNAYVYTVGKDMGFDLDRVIENAKTDDPDISARRFPGWGRDLLDPRYERYVAPPTFPVRDAP